MSETSLQPLFSEETQVLVPIALPEPEPLSPWLRSFLDSVRVHLLACYSIPEQTSPEQARDQFGDAASETLEDVADEFREFSSDIESSLVFTHDIVHTVERVADERDVDAIVRPREVARIRSVLAVVTRTIDYDRFVKCVSSLTAHDIERLKVVQVGSEGEDPDEQDLMLDGIASRLTERGVAEEIIETESLATANQTDEVIAMAEGFDVVIVAERKPTLTGRLAGTIAERVFRESSAPVVLVRLAE